VHSSALVNSFFYYVYIYKKMKLLKLSALFYYDVPNHELKTSKYYIVTKKTNNF